MALPKLGVPYYSLDLISGKEIKFRPFLVREEKALLVANESKDIKTIINTIKNTMSSCISSETPLDMDNIPIFELEWILLNIRMKSVGESSKFMVKCGECGKQNPAKIDLNKVTIENKENAEERKIMLNDSVGITIQQTPYRVLNTTKILDTSSPMNTIIIDVIAESITSVFTNDQVIQRRDFSKKEILEFVESMTQEQLMKIASYYEDPPKIRYEFETSCSCGHVIKKTFEGIADFF